MQNRTELSAEEWNQVRESFKNSQKYINEKNIDAMILGQLNDAKHLILAKNYIHYLKAAGIQPNAASFGRLLRIYNAAYHQYGHLTQQEQAEVLSICETLSAQHEVLDAISCENLIHGLVATTDWRRALDYFHMIKLSSTPSISAFSELSAKCFSEADMTLGWTLLHEMLAARKQPKALVFLTYLRVISQKANEAAFKENLVFFFEFLNKYEIVLTIDVVECLKEICQNANNYHVKSSKLNSAGKCYNCGKFMRHIAITEEEFNKLRDEFLERVLVRNDVFQKSTPEEVERFKRYVTKTAPYDCVIDGLNVAYSMGTKKQPKHLANLVAAIVKYFKQKQKHVLVLGRKHMNSWSKDAMQYVRNNASIFLTNDLTHDDPFLLYATLKSGLCTDFFSRDLMRAHAFLLGPDLKPIFRHWQQEHQYSLITQTVDGKIIIKEPIRFCINAHQVDNTWHLPYKQENVISTADNFEVPQKWLCVEIPE